MLVLDSADNHLLNISSYFPVGNRGTVLITTRNPKCEIHATAGTYRLGKMTENEAVTLMLRSTGVNNLADKSIRKNAKPVVSILGFLALAIVQAGAVIREGLCKMEEYCTIYSRRRRELLSQKAVQDTGDYRHTVYTTWEVSLKMIEEMSNEAGRDAIEILKIFSFLHYDGIPEAMFRRAWDGMQRGPCTGWMALHQPEILRRQMDQDWDAYPLRKAVSLLLSFSLINQDKDDLISMHPLVHTWARDRLNSLDEGTPWSQATSTVALSIPPTLQTVDYQFRRSLVPHIDACLGGQSDRIFHLHNAGGDCQRMANEFAAVYHEAGRQHDALWLRERELEFTKRTLGAEHSDTLLAKFNLAILYSEAGRQQEALQLTKQVLEAKRRAFGEEHPETLISLHSLAGEYSEMGQPEEALPLLEKVVKLSSRTLDEEYRDNFTLTAMYNLAKTYSKVGRPNDAVLLAEQVVNANKRIFGDENPETLDSIRSLAEIYGKGGRPGDAVRLLEKMVDAHERILGEEHPSTVGCRDSLARSYSEAGREREAVLLMEQVVEASKRILGEENPRTLGSVHSLALIYSNAGRHQEALEQVRS